MRRIELVPQHSPQTLGATYLNLLDAIKTREARIAVIGQGYVGLPLAMAFAEVGFTVSGIDVDQRRIESLQRFESITPDVKSETIEKLTRSGKYIASCDYSQLADHDVVLICVPTPLRKSKDPDISYVLETAQRLAAVLHPGQLIILESTTYPGTTDELLLPLFEEKDLVVGQDFFLSFSPERIDPGNKQFAVHEIPKVVGGITPQCTTLTAELYRQIVNKVIEVSSPKVAELAKLYENTFRSVNIALANELALMCRQLGVPSREVISAAASKPFGFMPFYPGPGIGGHCIPIDPAYLAWKMRLSNYEARFIPLAEEINQSMPGHVVQIINDELNQVQRCLNGAKVLAIGVAYKRGVSDIRESPALQVISNLIAKGANVSYSDPHVPTLDLKGNTLTSCELTPEELASADCVLILTDHPEVDYQQLIDNASLIVDTRDATAGLSKAAAGRIVSL